MWRVLLGKPGSVLTAGWPVAPAPDQVMARASAYIESFIPSLRKLIAKAEMPAKPKKGQPAEAPGKVTHGDVFISERYVGWQEKTLVALAGKFDAATKTFAADTTPAVLAAVQGDESLAGMNDKQLKQMIMPFAKFKQEEALAAGAQVRAARAACDGEGRRALLWCPMHRHRWWRCMHMHRWWRCMHAYMRALEHLHGMGGACVTGRVAATSVPENTQHQTGPNPAALTRAHAYMHTHLPAWGWPHMQVLDIKLPFDEASLIRDYLPYIKRGLGLESMHVHSASDTEAMAKAPIKVRPQHSTGGAPWGGGPAPRVNKQTAWLFRGDDVPV